MAFGLHRCSLACRPHPASLSVRVPTLAHLLTASFSRALTGSTLQFGYRYRHRFGRIPFNPIVHAHAGHTSARASRAAVGALADRFLGPGETIGEGADGYTRGACAPRNASSSGYIFSGS